MEPALDPAVLNTLRQLTSPGEPDVLTEVLKLVLDEVPPRVERLRNAWTTGNIQEVHRSAHSLKGSAGNIGARRLHAICGKLDGIGKSGELDGGGALVDELVAELDQVNTEIRRILDAA